MSKERDNYITCKCEQDKSCQFCGTGDAKKRCSACKCELYCNRECQKAAWKKHQLVCRLIGKEHNYYMATPTCMCSKLYPAMHECLMKQDPDMLAYTNGNVREQVCNLCHFCPCGELPVDHCMYYCGQLREHGAK